MTNDRFFKRNAGLSLALLCAAAAFGAAGCEQSPFQDAREVRPTAESLAAGGAQAQGPDAHSGTGPLTITAVGVPLPVQTTSLASDFGIDSGGIIVNIGAVGMDTSSIVIDGPFSKGVPLTNIPAPSGGNLIDLAFTGVANDQFIVNAMGVVGTGTALPTSGSFRPPDNLVFWFDVFPADDPKAVPLGLSNSDTSNVQKIICRGVILNLSARVADNQAISGTSTETAGAAKAGVSGTPFAAAVPPEFFANVPDAFRILVHRAGGGALNTHAPVFVNQVYNVAASQRILTVITIIQGVPGTDPVAISSAAELVLVQGNRSENCLDVLPSGPVFVPNVLAAPPPASIQTAVLNQNTGPFRLTGDNFGAGAVQWVSYIGRDESPVSYTYYDPGAGAMVWQRDPALNIVSGHVQIRSQTSVDSTTAGRLTWLRAIAVGGKNDGASSSDVAQAAMRTFPAAAPVGAPRSLAATATISGRVANAPPGTIITIAETQPTFFCFFNPITQTPGAVPTTPGFFSATAGAPATTLPLSAPVLRTTVRPGEDGQWAAFVPAGFFVQAVIPGVPLERSTSYIARAIPPGGGTPVTLGTVTATRTSAGPFDLGTTDIGVSSNVGFLRYEIRDSSGSPMPGQITALTTGLAPVPLDLGIPTALELPLDRAATSGNIAMTATGLGTMPLPAGTYTFVASAGLEFETDTEASVAVAAGQETALFIFTLNRAVNNPRVAVAADFHVHCGDSIDSSVPAADRIVSLLATGIEVAASTEHDRIGDVGRAMGSVPGASGRLKTLAGMEFTTDTGWLTPNPSDPTITPQCIGHWNAYPLARNPSLRKSGAPEDEFKPPALSQAALRFTDGVFGPPTAEFNEIIQLNHPRSVTAPPGIEGGDGFFSNLAFVFNPVFGGPVFGQSSGSVLPIQPLAIQLFVNGAGSPAPASLVQILAGTANFDTYEVVNGAIPVSEWIRNQADWFALLNRGVMKTAVGVSDTHRIDDRQQLGLLLNPASPRPRFDASAVGIARTLLLTTTPPASLTNADVVSLLKPSYQTPASAGFPNLAPAPFVANRMKAIVTTGPMIDVQVSFNGQTFSNPIGQRLVGTGPVTVTVTVTGPTWVTSEVKQIRLLRDGGEYPTLGGSGNTAGPGGPVTVTGVGPHVATFTFDPGVLDSWFVVEASGVKDIAALTIEAPPVTSTYGQLYPGHETLIPFPTTRVPIFAFTNPIFIDADGAAATFDATQN